MTLTNDVAELSGVVNVTSADVTLDMDRRDCSFKINLVVLCQLVISFIVAIYNVGL